MDSPLKFREDMTRRLKSSTVLKGAQYWCPRTFNYNCFPLAWPRRHCETEKRKIALSGIHELEYGALGNYNGDARFYCHRFLISSLLSPDLSFPLEEIPNFLHCFVLDCLRDAAHKETTMSKTTPLETDNWSDLRTIWCYLKFIGSFLNIEDQTSPP